MAALISIKDLGLDQRFDAWIKISETAVCKRWKFKLLSKFVSPNTCSSSLRIVFTPEETTTIAYQSRKLSTCHELTDNCKKVSC